MGLFTLVFVWLQRKRFEPGVIHQLDKPMVGSLGAFALPLVPLSLLSWLNSYTSPLILKHLMGYSATGIYTSALGLASTINIIQAGFNTYWAPYVLENYQSDDRRRFFTVHRLMACLLTLFGLSITILQTPVFLLLGKAYRSSAVFFPFLFLSPICYCLGETTGMGITISKKTYWTTLIYLFSALVNIGLCFVFIPPMGMAGAAAASALSAVLTLLLRTWVGEHYYRVLDNWRYLALTIGLMTITSIANLLLTGVVKYALLVAVLLAACVLFGKEIRTLWTAALQIVSSILHKRRERA
jgi:O-antigen/teichoic acid export membrane protein